MFGGFDCRVSYLATENTVRSTTNQEGGTEQLSFETARTALSLTNQTDTLILSFPGLLSFYLFVQGKSDLFRDRAHCVVPVPT